MEKILMLLALALSGAWAGIRLALKARAEARRLAARNLALEAKAVDAARDLAEARKTAADDVRQLAEAETARTDFLAGLSHELRTPLNAVIGFAELMRMNVQAEPLTRRQSQAVDHILASGQSLLGLIEEVLDYARIEAGRVSLSIEAVDPHLVARQVCDALRPEAKAAGLTLTAPPPTAGFGIIADRTRLRQVLIHLVANAIRYNRPGGTVFLQLRQTAGGVALSVHDTGVGISEARMAGLFQPFNTQGGQFTDMPAPGAGSGMGLAVSRRLVEAMQGRLEAASREGEGSIFTLTLPLARSAAPDITASPVPALERPDLPGGATLLYVEDNPSNIALMRHVIAALGGIRLHVAETGHEGLTLARDLRPDVIILDINLPGLDGFELKARLDADPLTRGLPVLALSASARPADLKRGRAAGFRDYLTKPIDIPVLARALNSALMETVERNAAIEAALGDVRAA